MISTLSLLILRYVVDANGLHYIILYYMEIEWEFRFKGTQKYGQRIERVVIVDDLQHGDSVSLC